MWSLLPFPQPDRKGKAVRGDGKGGWKPLLNRVSPGAARKRVALSRSLTFPCCAWGHSSGGRSSPASQDAIKSCPGAGCTLQRHRPQGVRSFSPSSWDFSSLCDGCLSARVWTPSAHTVHPSFSPSLGTIAGKRLWTGGIEELWHPWCLPRDAGAVLGWGAEQKTEDG